MCRRSESNKKQKAKEKDARARWNEMKAEMYWKKMCNTFTAAVTFTVDISAGASCE